MKPIEINSGTREEIIAYVRTKVTGVIKDVTNGAKAFGEVGERLRPFYCKDGELYELESNTIESQIDTCIESGSPIVVVSLAGNQGMGTYREMFFVTDYSNIKANMEMERLDNVELRDRRINAIKMVMSMELDAEERWNRILKIVDEYRGKTITL